MAGSSGSDLCNQWIEVQGRTFDRSLIYEGDCGYAALLGGAPGANGNCDWIGSPFGGPVLIRENKNNGVVIIRIQR